MSSVARRDELRLVRLDRKVDVVLITLRHPVRVEQTVATAHRDAVAVHRSRADAEHEAERMALRLVVENGSRHPDERRAEEAGVPVAAILRHGRVDGRVLAAPELEARRVRQADRAANEQDRLLSGRRGGEPDAEARPHVARL